MGTKQTVIHREEKARLQPVGGCGGVTAETGARGQRNSRTGPQLKAEGYLLRAAAEPVK